MPKSFSLDRRIDWTDFRREFQRCGTVAGAIYALQAKGWTYDEACAAHSEYNDQIENARIEAARQRARAAQGCGYAITAEDAALIKKGGQKIAEQIRAGAKQGDSI